MTEQFKSPNVDSSEFDFNKEIEEVKWLVDGLIPLGQLIICLARSGQGKSYLTESMIMKVLCEESFLGKTVIGGDVLLIDQDTTTRDLEIRMKAFRKLCGEPKHKLWIKSHEDLSFSSGTVIQCIEAHPSTRLVVLDTYHSMLGNFNPNSTTDSNYVLSNIRTRCVNSNRTVWINHHLTEKSIIETGDMMFGDILGLAMGNSAIIQRADSVFVLCGSVEDGELKHMAIRPWGKRVIIKQKPFVVDFKDMEFTYAGELMGNSDECINDIRILFYEHPKEGFNVEEIYKGMGKKHGINKLYKYLAVMEKDNEIIMERGKSNQFKYFYNKDGDMPHVIMKQWAVGSVTKPQENSQSQENTQPEKIIEKNIAGNAEKNTDN